MNKLSRFGKKLSNIADSASQKTNELVETAKMNAEISRLEADIEDLQFELGKLYYSDNKQNADSPYNDIIVKIHKCEKEIHDCNQRILAHKGLEYCTHCGGVVANADEFCSKCGRRLNQSHHKEEEDIYFCGNCGQKVEGDKQHCPYCGFLIK
ncbi:zinc ribbon domain-containing protein [Eubacteriales bacterium OttesenSCG-928-K08]|nr:zinc ribbon domain-containing protein [Eubacteriales bacterium OttesenSCG-928-K08]